MDEFDTSLIFEGPMVEFEVTGDNVLLNDLAPNVEAVTKRNVSLVLETDEDNIEFVSDHQERIRSNNVVNYSVKTKNKIVNDINEGKDVNEDLNKAEAEIDELQTGLHPEVAAFIYKSDDDNIFKNKNELSHYRLEQMRHLVMGRFKESSSSFWDGLGYFADLMVSYPVDVLSGGGFTRQQYVDELMKAAADNSLSNDEFVARVKEILDEVADTGIFTDDNWFYTGQFIDDYMNNGGDLDKIFTVVDAVPIAGAVLRAGKRLTHLKSTTKLRTSDDLAAAVAPQEAVKKQIDTKIKSGEATPEQVKSTTPAAERPMDTNFLNGFFNAAGREALVDNELQWRILDLIRKKDFGYFVNPETWERMVPELAKKYEGIAKSLAQSRFLDVHIDDGMGFVSGSSERLGNPLAIGVYGTTKGKIYNKNYKAKAEAFAKEIGGEVRPVVQEGKEGFVVVKEWNIKTDGLVDRIDQTDITTHLFQLLFSPSVTSSKKLGAVLKRAEGQLGATFVDIIKDYNRIRKGTSNETRKFLDDVFTDLNSGSEAARREALTTSEFKQRFFDKFGKQASEKDLEYFRMTQDLNNAAYVLLADKHFKEVVNRGGKMYFDKSGNEFLVFPTQSVDRTKVTGLSVWDADNNRRMEMPDDLVGVYEVNGGYRLEDGTVFQYIYSAEAKFRRVFHNDVLGYNAGGPRVYDEFKRFVGQADEVDVAGVGTKRVEHNFLGTRTEKEAVTAVDEINTLFKAVREKLAVTGSRFNDYQRMRNLRTDTEFDNLVATNTNWHQGINSVDDFVDFVEQHRLNVGKDVQWKADSERLTDDLNFFASTSGYDSGVDFMRRSSFNSRSDKPLVGYGGEQASVLPPHVAIERNFTRQLTSFANSSYSNQAVKGWLKGADHAKVLAEPLDSSKSPLDQLLSAKLKNSRVADAFEQERRVIRRRIANEDAFTKKWNKMVGSVADWVYGRLSKKLGVSVENMFSSNPLHAMRSLAFNLKLGLFAFDQMIVQSAQAINVTAIGGVNGLRGAALSWPLMLAMYNGTKPFATWVGRRVSGIAGISADEFDELVTFMKESGRFAVGREVAEQDMNFNLSQGVVGKLLKAGRVPFDTGERFARISAAAVAYLDFKRQFPKVNPNTTPQAKLIMAERMDILTAGMTSASATAWQRNSASAVPLQFMSYTSRMMEQLMTGKVLTGAERFRLGAAQTFMWGLSGVGLGWAVDKYLLDEELINSMNRDMYTMLRYGAADFTVGMTTGSRTAFAERLAFPDAIFEMLEDVTEGKFWEVISGPSGSIGTSVVGDVISALGHAIHGRYIMAEQDFVALGKNITAVSRLSQAYHLASMNKYFSRRGSEVADTFDSVDAMWKLMGAPLQDVEFTYERLFTQRDRKKALDEIGFMIKDKVTRAANMIGNGDIDAGHALLAEVGALMSTYDPMDRDYLTRFMKPEALNLLERVIKRELTTRPNSRVLESRTGE